MRIIQSTVAVCTCRRYLVPIRTHTHTQNNFRIKWAISILYKLQAMNLLDANGVNRANEQHTHTRKKLRHVSHFRVSPLLASSVGIRLAVAEPPVSTVFIWRFFRQTYLVLSPMHCAGVCPYHIRAHSLQNHNSQYRFHSMYCTRWWRRWQSYLFL